VSEGRVRPATRDDLPLMASFIRELAAYEDLTCEVRFDEAELGEYLFGSHPCAEALIGDMDGEAAGFALFFRTFSTFEGKPGLWLEDLFVRPSARGRGLGRALLIEVAKLASERHYARLEWSVLDWNAPAIALYRKLGARMMDEWRIMRLDGARLAQVIRP